jgi:hypothetical protein
MKSTMGRVLGTAHTFQQFTLCPTDSKIQLVSQQPTRHVRSNSESFIHTSTYYFYYSNTMPVPPLPPEIWAMIAKYVKRESPPVGERGNWN